MKRSALPVCLLVSGISTACAQPRGARGVRGALAGEPVGVASRIRAIDRLLEGHTDRRDEAKILALLRSASDAELDRLMRKLDLVELLDGVDDRPVGPDHKDALLTMLGQTRVAALSIPARARLIDALQTGRTSRREAQAVRDLFLRTRGVELTRLKDLVDRGADHRDLRQLLFVDIDRTSIREPILDHFAREAKPTGRVRVVSDIDDTLYSNWKDKRYPKGALYPGVLAFQQELNRGGHTAFLTARPSERDGWIERRTHRTLRRKGVPDASVLSGNLRGILGHGAMAARKRRNFEDYRRLFPEYGFVFTGDSGQGDARFAAEILKDDPGALRGAWIHDVTGASASERERMERQGLRVFDTYVGAARAAYDAQLIGRAGLGRVARAAVRDYLATRFDSVRQQAAARAQLQRDIAAVNALLPPARRVRF